MPWVAALSLWRIKNLPSANEVILNQNKLLQRVNGLPIQDSVMKWKHSPRYWPFVRGIHQSPVNSQHKYQWRRALMFSLICVWTNVWVNNGHVIWAAIALIMTSLCWWFETQSCPLWRHRNDLSEIREWIHIPLVGGVSFGIGKHAELTRVWAWINIHNHCVGKGRNY